MTNHWTDYQNAKVFMIFCNPVENHPCTAQWINKAKDEGANVIVVDPRRTRSVALVNPDRGDLYVRIRPGTDNAFVNGLINKVIARIEASALRDDHLTATTNSRVWHAWDAGGNRVPASGAPPAADTNRIAGWPVYSDATLKLNPGRTDYDREDVATIAGGNTVKQVPKRVTRSDPDSVFQYLKSRVASYDSATVARICGCSENEFNAAADLFINNSWAATSGTNQADPKQGDADYKVGSVLYAMGTTQHSTGSQMCRNYCILQTLLGNMGRPGGGVNAQRGIGNVQGSTDQGVLVNSVPGYSSSPTTSQNGTVGYTDYMNKLFGNPINSTDPAGTLHHYQNVANYGLQQRGFYNMTSLWFSNGTKDPWTAAGTGTLFDYWPRVLGYEHRTMFQKMISGDVKAFVCIGQNPVQTESNTMNNARAGLRNVNTLVVADTFLTETSNIKQAGDPGVTYFLPAAAFSEECGTFATSGRWLQWRRQGTVPKGSSINDMEIILRLAQKLHANNGIVAADWALGDTLGDGTKNVPAGTTFADIWGRYGFDGTTWLNTDYQKTQAFDGASGYAENVFAEMARPLGSAGTGGKGGTVWIYSRGGGDATTGNTGGWDPLYTVPAADTGGGTNATPNRSMSRSRTNTNVISGVAAVRGLYPRWGHAWLLNRRIFYNQNGVATFGNATGDVGDLFVAMDQVARLFVHISADTPPLADYNWLYRAYTKLAELDGRTPKHWEPWESSDPVLAAAYPPEGTAPLGAVGSIANYPLTYTTFRHIEHYQGGSMSRNVPYLVELQPKPILEVNSVDAAAAGIKEGAQVWLHSIRTEGNTSLPDGVGPFIAQIGSGSASQQKVGKGLVASSYAWGEVGQVTSDANANKLTIDALDKNANMPETKVCLVRISKVVNP